MKLNSLAQVEMREEHKKGVEVLANGVNKELGEIRVAENDRGVMKQVFKVLGGGEWESG